jgi:putative nucleotidyltransferase with HDIG domain
MGRKMHISQCSERQVLAQDVRDRQGGFLLPRGTPLNDYIIKKLEELGVEYVRVSNREKSSELSYINCQAFEKRYKSSVDEVRRLALELTKGKKTHISTINRMTRTIANAGEEPKHVIKCLGSIRDTDDYTYYHCLNVAFYATMIAGWLNLVRDDINITVEAALLHDLGKTQISKELLNKREKLNFHEMEEIKKHTIYGYRMIEKNIHIPEEIKDVVLMHHEREDGSGYPLGLGGEKLSIYAKIVAVADVYDAMTSDRPYKNAMTPFDAFEQFSSTCKDTMDMHIVNTLLYNMSRYYIGSRVLLSNGQTGNIVYIPPDSICKPIVDTGVAFLDLSREKGISVTGIY